MLGGFCPLPGLPGPKTATAHNLPGFPGGFGFGFWFEPGLVGPNVRGETIVYAASECLKKGRRSGLSPFVNISLEKLLDKNFLTSAIYATHRELDMLKVVEGEMRSG